MRIRFSRLYKIYIIQSQLEYQINKWRS